MRMPPAPGCPASRRRWRAGPSGGQAGEQHAREVGPELLLEPRADRDPLLLDDLGAPGGELAMGEQAIEGPLGTSGIGRLRHGAHVFEIVAHAPDNIPRTDLQAR